jgi:hypothetical protein
VSLVAAEIQPGIPEIQRSTLIEIEEVIAGGSFN